MHVSFVIPLFNCLPLTQAMLASLRATIPAELSHEIILVDDGSTDGTRDWLGSLQEPHLQVLLNEENVGYAASNNRAAGVARGDLLILLNNDLILSAGWLEPMLDLHAALRAPGAIGNVQTKAQTGEIDHRGIFINAKGKPEHLRSRPSPWERSAEVTAVTGACLLIARELWQALKGFDEGFVNGCEDVDLCLRAATQRRTNAVALTSVIQHHVSASPGRKRKDEANTRRLTLRWRDELVLRGARAWSEDYLARALNAATGFRRPFASARIAAHAFGLLPEPPPETIAGLQGAIDLELQRWEELLGQA